MGSYLGELLDFFLLNTLPSVGSNRDFFLFTFSAWNRLKLEVNPKYEGLYFYPSLMHPLRQCINYLQVMVGTTFTFFVVFVSVDTTYYGFKYLLKGGKT